MPYSSLKGFGQDSGTGRIIESYFKVKQDPKEPFSDFLQRLTKAVQIEVTDPDARQVLTESLDLENAKRYLGL